MAQVIEERWMFTIKIYPDGRKFATAPVLIGQNIAKPKEQKQAPAPLEISQENKESKSLFDV